MTNNVRYIYLLIQEASQGDGVGLHLRSYNAWESGEKQVTKTIKIKTDMCMIGWNKFGITYRFKIMYFLPSQFRFHYSF